MSLSLPPGWVEQVAAYPAAAGPPGAEWVRDLPRTVASAMGRWGLAHDGAPRTGRTALVLPVRRQDEPLALKVAWPHPEGRLEHLALRHWDGDGAVRLVAALPSDGVLLLQRLDADEDLRGMWADQACEVIGGLLRRLHVAAPPQVESLAASLGPHLDRMAGRPAVPRRVVDRTLGLARELLAEPEPRLLLHADLHYEKVLRSPDGEWLAIDPAPLSGHPGYELLPALHHRVAEMGTGSALRWSVRRRLSVLAEAAGVDEEEARAWSLLRAGIRASRATERDAESMTTTIAVAKALDD